MKNSKTISFYRVASYLLMLGVIHSALTPFFYKSLSPDALWFFATGLSLVFLSMLNIAASRILAPWLLTMTLIANITGTLHSIVTLIVLNAPQAYVGLLFFVITLFACWSARRQMIQLDKALL